MNIECCEPSIYCNPTKISIQSIGTIQGNARVTFLSFNVVERQIYIPVHKFGVRHVVERQIYIPVHKFGVRHVVERQIYIPVHKFGVRH